MAQSNTAVQSAPSATSSSTKPIAEPNRPASQVTEVITPGGNKVQVATRVLAKATKPDPSKELIAEYMKLPNTSTRIRAMHEDGYTMGQISKSIPNAKGGKLLFQHVRNVLHQPIKRTASNSAAA